jgi:hypothetical protein
MGTSDRSGSFNPRLSLSFAGLENHFGIVFTLSCPKTANGGLRQTSVCFITVEPINTTLKGASKI